jgi:hypothetical protein
MVNRLASLSVVGLALAAAALPQAAAAADYYDEGRGSVVLPAPDGVDLDRPRRFAPRGPGPVVFDERGRGFDRPGPVYGGPELRRGPGMAEELDDEGPSPGPRFGRPLFNGPYRPALAVVDDGYGDRIGRPDVGCEIQRTESVTPAGWRKIVTHRTCYRR